MTAATAADSRKMTHEMSEHAIMTIRTLQIAGLITIGLCAPALAQPADPLAPVAWISGCWIAEGKEHGSGEMWLAPAGGTMLGVSRTVRTSPVAPICHGRDKAPADQNTFG